VPDLNGDISAEEDKIGRKK